MILRIVATGLALSLLSLASAYADEPAGGEFEVPPPRTVTPPPPAPEEPVTAAPPPHVEFQRLSVAAGIGLSWGGGTLNFEGRDYAFKMKGLSLLDVGASKIVASGDVTNLTTPTDLEGRYVAVEAGASIGRGVGAFAMRNEKGVVISLQSQSEGVQLTLATQGFSIELD